MSWLDALAYFPFARAKGIRFPPRIAARRGADGPPDAVAADGRGRVVRRVVGAGMTEGYQRVTKRLPLCDALLGADADEDLVADRHVPRDWHLRVHAGAVPGEGGHVELHRPDPQPPADETVEGVAADVDDEVGPGVEVDVVLDGDEVDRRLLAPVAVETIG
jgi:hypothetical protein